MTSFAHSLRAPIRSVGRDRRFVIPSLLMMAIGIGAVCSSFILFDSFLLRSPQHVAEPERLVLLEFEVSGGRSFSTGKVSYFSYLALKDALRDAADLSGRAFFSTGLGVGADSIQIDAALVDDNYFDMLGVRPVIGRTFSDKAKTSERLAVLGYDLWRRRYKASRDRRQLLFPSDDNYYSRPGLGLFNVVFPSPGTRGGGVVRA